MPEKTQDRSDPEFRMDGYWVGKLLFEASGDPELMKEFQGDPDAVIARYPLSERAAQALRDRDRGTIYGLGVHPLLVRMGCHVLFGPIGTPEYRDALSGVVPVDY